MQNIQSAVKNKSNNKSLLALGILQTMILVVLARMQSKGHCATKSHFGGSNFADGPGAGALCVRLIERASGNFPNCLLYSGMHPA